ncbi:substrate-binding domain-containing protein [Streptomyces aidingensis]|uniref:Uncharacterized protein n=1 Tax=Streptomyces aidingensis TaxID=910347 RepID=A0A1I1HH88_9ACTN|nr:substrate-binding domain-containing protein [Streptomyces aidingensis]SFC23397.1 hypothetical protein SAMN05421773_102388 [Streptomyces aidingensis]
MNVKSVKRGAFAAAGAAALGLTLLAAPAQADPYDGAGNHEWRQFAIVGSDTTQQVMTGLADGIIGTSIEDPDLNPAELWLGNYDATQPVGWTPPSGVNNGEIRTKPVGWPSNCVIDRPNGSSAGITALRNDIAAGTGCVDIARSSRGPRDTSGDLLTFVPFAQDGVTWASRDDSPLAGEDLTLAELRDIYQCTTTSLNGVTLQPLVPQAGSGTRGYWTDLMGIEEDLSDAPCVSDNVSGTPVQEHDGTILSGSGQIMPYSIPQWLSQLHSATTQVPDRRGDSELNLVAGAAPYTGTSGNEVMNSSFPVIRPVYNVVETARIDPLDPAYDADLESVVVGSTSEVCQRTSTITGFGFATHPNCGDTSLTANN